MLSRNGDEHGRLFRYSILISLALIFFSSLVLLILSLYYYNRMVGDPSFVSAASNEATAFLYLTTIPILTLIQTLIQLLLSNCSLYLTPRAAVAVGSIFILGWITAASIWTDCELILPISTGTLLPSWCPQSMLSSTRLSGVVFERGLAITKDALGWLVTASHVGYLISASIAWRKEMTRGKIHHHELGIELETF